MFLACAGFTSLPLSANADQPVPATAKEEEKQESRPIQEAVDVPATENPQLLQYKNNKLELNLPKGYFIKKFAPAGKTEYAFSGPKNPDGTAPG